MWSDLTCVRYALTVDGWTVPAMDAIHARMAGCDAGRMSPSGWIKPLSSANLRKERWPAAYVFRVVEASP